MGDTDTAAINSNDPRDELMTRKTWTAGLVLALVAGMVGSFGGMAYANHQFSDVAPGSFFHDNVAAIKDAGCAGGYNDGTFQTSQAVTRGQFTLWFQNCLPRVSHVKSTSPLSFPAAGPTPTVLLTDTITTGGFPGETQFVRITGNVDVRPTDNTFGSCGGSPIICDIEVTIYVGSTPVQTHITKEVNDSSFSESEYRNTITVDTVVSVPTDTTTSFSLRGTSQAVGSFQAENRTLTAQTVPFGPSGTNAGP